MVCGCGVTPYQYIRFDFASSVYVILSRSYVKQAGTAHENISAGKTDATDVAYFSYSVVCHIVKEFLCGATLSSCVVCL